MAQTIYATFNNIEQAEKAAGALLDHGVLKEDLTVIGNGTNRQAQEVPVGANDTGYPQNPEVTYGSAPFLVPTGAIPEGPGLGTMGVVYTPTGFGDVASTTTEIYNDAAIGDGFVDDDQTRGESVAKSGLTTTTLEDAEAGAVKGTGIGLGIGILAGLAALIVPGVGLVFGGGALAAAIGAAALTTASGAAVGGVVGYLKDQGVNEVDAFRYQNAIGVGAALLAVSLPSNGIDLQETELVLNKYGATDISNY